jgi:phenylalanyl-tRNA synthetase alpha chain
MTIGNQISDLRSSFLGELKGIATSKELEDLKVRYLGKKGPITELMISLKNCTPEERPELGKLVNQFKEEITSHCDHTLARIKIQEQEETFEAEWLDPTLPGRRAYAGRMHPIQQMMQRMLDVLVGMGFSVQTGPDLDTDYYNFEALNFPKDHPARDMLDTFYFSPHLLLRTHTTNIQSRIIEKEKPPIRIAMPGRVFRNEDISARSHVFFHQVDGLYIDTNVTFADLMATLTEFISKLLGEKVETRFRPSYFPFVEPGLEVDVRCTRCRGSGCRICKQTGWLEILGAGMVHPNILRKANIDPETHSGYAWGMGLERLAINYFDIPDIRLFTENDVRFLEQFH